jgi:Putative Actinobacterial Holin-X, holin superfamily III
VTEDNLAGTIKKTVADVKRLARLQADLARQRVQSMARKKAMFAAMGAGGSLFLLYGLLFMFGTAAAGLAIVFPVWLALLIVGGGLLFLGALLMGIGAIGLKGSKKKSPEHESPEEVPWLQAKSS